MACRLQLHEIYEQTKVAGDTAVADILYALAPADIRHTQTIRAQCNNNWKRGALAKLMLRQQYLAMSDRHAQLTRLEDLVATATKFYAFRSSRIVNQVAACFVCQGGAQRKATILIEPQ